MKGAPLVCSVILMSGLAIWPAWDVLAEEASQEGPPGLSLPFIKLGRGVLNIGTGLSEFPLQIYRTGSRDGWIAGTVFGPIEGLGMFIARTLGGAYEILTFPLPLPPRYQPMFEPEFPWSPEPPPVQESNGGS